MLPQLFKNHNEKPIIKWSHYLEHYDRHLSKYRGKSITVLEIGVQEGGSLQLWKKYFGKDCRVVGIDIDKKYRYQEDQIFVEIGDQSDLSFLKRIVDKYGLFDIIIDDGSHFQNHIRASFDFLYDYVKSDGIYIIEDLHCAYFPSFNGGLKAPMNFINYMLNYIHDINFRYIKESFYIKKLKNLKSMCFYDSILFIEKEPENIERYSEIRGKDLYKKVFPNEIF